MRLNMLKYTRSWGYSSVGRALEWHSRGQGFDSPYLHHLEPRSNPWFFFICIKGVAGIIVKTKPYEKIISYKNNKLNFFLQTQLLKQEQIFARSVAILHT